MRSLKSVLPYLLVILLLIAGVLLRLHLLSVDHFETARDHHQQSRFSEAVESYEWTIQSYSPLTSRVEPAIAALESIAAQAEQSGDLQLAREAWQSLVSGLSVIRHVTQPYPTILANAQSRLQKVERSMIEARTASAQPNLQPNPQSPSNREEESP